MNRRRKIRSAAILLVGSLFNLGCESTSDPADRARDLRDVNSELQAKLAEGALIRGDVDGARDRSREALRIDPNRSDAIRVLARAELLAGRSREALIAAQRAAQLAADDPNAWLLVFDCADAAGEDVTAADALDRAAELGSFDAEFARAALALETRDDTLLVALIERSPDHVAAVTLHAEFLASRGDIAAALAAIDRAIETASCPALLDTRARLRFELGESGTAESIAPQNPGSDSALIHASTALRDGSHHTALAGYRAAIAEAPHAVAPRVGLGESLLRSGDQLGALAAFEAALERDSSDLDARLGAARVLLLEANYVAATRHLERALGRDRDHAPTRGLLVAAALGAGDLERARTEATALRRIDPGGALDLKCRELIGRAEAARR